MCEPIDRKQYPWAELERYVRTIADQMGLKNWHIHVSREAPERASDQANVFMPYNSVETTMRFGESFLTSTPEKQRWCVVHECLHLLDAERYSVVMSTLKDGDAGALSAPQWALFERAYSNADERFVDMVSRMLAPLFPLPAWQVNEEATDANPRQDKAG